MRGSAGIIRLASACCGATVFILTLYCGGAQAGVHIDKQGGYHYVYEGFLAMPKSKVETHTARCPEGTYVLGGGNGNPGKYGDVTQLHGYPFDSSDDGRKPDNGWAVEVRGPYFEPIRSTVHAICSDRPPEYTRATMNVTASDWQIEEQSCRNSALDPVSAGTKGPGSVREIESRPVEGSWSVGLMNSSEKDRVVETVLICAPGVSYGQKTALVRPQRRQVAIARCPLSEHNVVGGGVFSTYQGSPPIAVGIGLFRPKLGRDREWTGWASSLDNYYGTGKISISAYASCLADR